MGRDEGPRSQLRICTLDCGARCCRYITTKIQSPRSHNDWDEVRWWLAHGGTMVTRDEDGWMLHVETRCRHLREDRTCGIYRHRMRACEEYDPEACEFVSDVDFEVTLRTEGDLAAFLEARGLKRGALVALRIRLAAASRHNRREEAPAPSPVP